MGSAFRKLSNRALIDDETTPPEEQELGVTGYFRTHLHIEQCIAAVGGERCLSF